MRHAYILSAKYAPGHFSHLIAFYKLFEELNFEPCLLLAEKYRDFISKTSKVNSVLLADVASIKADILLIYNLSMQDVKIVDVMRGKNPCLKVLFVYHEPWYGFGSWFSNYIKHNESFLGSVKAFGRHLFAIGVLHRSNCILLASNRAVEIYKRYDARLNENYHFFPLIFSDEAGNAINFGKTYFSFIGTADTSKNFELFLEFIRHRARHDALASFKIATRIDISKYIDSELSELVSKERLIINHGHNLTNEEINHAYSISKCIWNLYKQSTQSGVLCKAMMFGSPVIASNIGSFSEIVNGKNGIVLADGYSVEDIDRAYDKIIGNLEEYSKNARETFLKNFFYKNQVTRFSETLINDM